MVIKAKPVVDNQFWILKQNDRKVGNIEATGDGFSVKIDNQVTNFKTISLIRQRANIEFEQLEKLSVRKSAVNHVHDYPAGSKVYNPIWNVQYRLPLYTKTEKSKSWFAAGWYRVCQHKTWKTVQSPKLITLERYKYQGPFFTKEQANDQSVS